MIHIRMALIRLVEAIILVVVMVESSSYNFKISFMKYVAFVLLSSLFVVVFSLVLFKQFDQPVNIIDEPASLSVEVFNINFDFEAKLFGRITYQSNNQSKAAL